MARQIKANTSTTTTTTNTGEHAQHYINRYEKGTRIKVDYSTIDKRPDLVAICQAHPDNANKLFGNEFFDAEYNQRGVSTAPKSTLDLSGFAV